MRLTQAHLTPFSDGYITIANQQHRTLIVGRIRRIELRLDPEYGPMIDLYYLWKASTWRPQEWPNHWEEPGGYSLEHTPDIMSLNYHTFSEGEKGRLTYVGTTNGDYGTLSRPNDPLFNERDVPEGYRHS